MQKSNLVAQSHVNKNFSNSKPKKETTQKSTRPKMPSDDLMEKIVSLCKRRGFVFQSSEIYGGLGSAWDYGPLGAELKRNLKNAWWKSVVHDREDMVGLDASILMHSAVWKASGHADHFADPFLKCSSCERHFRADKIWDEIFTSPWGVSLVDVIKKAATTMDWIRWAKTEGKKMAPELGFIKNPEVTISWISESHEKFGDLRLNLIKVIERLAATPDGVSRIPCPHCGHPFVEEGTPASLMLQTFLGPIYETAEKVYLRPETAQGIFVNFANILDTTNRKLPFGVAQIGKAFRNEITPGNFTFRTREFEQMEIEYFATPSEAQKCYVQWIEERHQWYLRLGIKKDNLRLRPHGKDELAHYAAACTDIEYNFPFGWSELEGIANRTDFDLRQHSQHSGKDLRYHDKISNEKFFPYIIEPSGGVDRATLAFLVDAYHEEKVKEETRVVLRFSKELAPIKVAVLPLLKKNAQIVELARKIKQDLQKHLTVVYDDTAAIGKLYRRQDEVGTFYCVTIDVQSLEDKQVTVRDRDTMGQERVSVDRLKQYLLDKFSAK